MKLIIESPSGFLRKKEIGNKNTIIFEALLHTSDEPNSNGRIYPLEVMKNAVNSIKNNCKERSFGGELDHPLPSDDQQYSYLRHITVKLQNLSHIIRDMWFEGNKLIGTLETLNTPLGITLANLIRDNITIGFSIRAITDNLEKDGKYEIVQPPLTLIAVDAVSSPSHKDAKITRILNIENKISEGKEILEQYYIDKNNWLYRISPYKYNF